MENHLSLLADIVSGVGFGIFTLNLAYFDNKLSNPGLSDDDEIVLRKSKYKKNGLFFLVAGICFVCSIILKIFCFLM